MKLCNKNIQKGDIWFVTDGDIRQTGNEMWSNRPGVVISNNTSNKYSGVISVVYLTTSKNKKINPTHIPVMSGGQKAIALCEQIVTVDNSRLTDYIGKLAADEAANVDSALMFQLGINPATRPTNIFKKWENYINAKNINVDEYVPATKEKPINTEYVKLITKENEVLRDEIQKYKELYEGTKKQLFNI